VSAVAAFGPGRVNLLGEHTDYNDGLCLPFAIARGVSVRAEAIDGGRVLAHADDLGEDDDFPAADPGRDADGWRAFVRGTFGELGRAGHAVGGTRLSIAGDVPRGAGLSSSAALSTGLALALLALGGEESASEGEPGADQLDRRELARLCSRVENDWVGAQTGLLDQLAALFGRAGHVLRLDCRDLSIEEVPLDLKGWTLAVAPSGHEHVHAASGYNQRRAECREAAELLGLASLRDAPPDAPDRLPEPLNRRVRHVLTENARVDAAVTALRDGDLGRLGELIDASHASLRDDYEVSIDAVEQTVNRVKAAGAAGARIMGGGFGGSVLALFAPGAHPPDDATVVEPAGPARVSPADT
jgi:galactokinase